MLSLRKFDLQYVKGIGPKRAEILEKQLGIRSAYDLLRHFPTHYLDRSQTRCIDSLRDDEATSVMVKGRFLGFQAQGEGAKRRLISLFTDGTGALEVVWFRNIKNTQARLRINTDYYLFGKPTKWNGRWQMSHPEIDTPETIEKAGSIRGVYPLTEGLRNNSITARIISGWVKTILTSHPRLSDPLPAEVIASRKLMPLRDALCEIHFPTTPEKLEKARYRLKFEEIFGIQVDMLHRERKRKSLLQGHRFLHVGKYFNDFYSNRLPFPLTNAQKRVIREVRRDVNTGRQMNRLVQGDVGSGKTIVALLCMLIAKDNGFQCCMMAPTEILANQHFESLSSMLDGSGVNVGLLTGNTSAKKRESLHRDLENGELDILVGTHALIEKNVKFKNLGLAVIDEQHRFGVAQRAALWAKNDVPPHVMVMTATPIPRTLAMTVYGDLDVSVIDELPPGRKPIVTVLRYEEQRQRVYRALYKELEKGAQAYIVYPLIEENEKIDLKSLNEGYEIIKQTFPKFSSAFVHGRMKQAEKDYQMELFASGKARILVATTVIEVGVNVPSATVMIIENAERFGLSQLHQLRGRVGRGGDQSYCILMSKYKIARETRKRLELMTQTTDGFVIAEADMSMRGPGDIEGTMQSGIPFDLKIANLATDGLIVQQARESAEKLLDSDPELTRPDNASYRRFLTLLASRNADWSKIS